VSRIPLAIPLLFLARLAAPGQDFQDFQKNVTDFTLPNGIHFLVVERHDAPQVSVRVYIGAGAVNDPAGATGLAHLFENLALVGTEGIGAKDAANERKAMDAAEEIRDRIAAEQNKGLRADDTKVRAIGMELSRATAQAALFGNFTEFLQARGEGGISGSVRVTADSTLLESSFPSNRSELWFLTEAQRLSKPVYRNFYTERDQVAGNFRNVIENAPGAKILMTLAGAAFVAHPYGRPVYGWPSDLSELRLNDARQFFAQYWVPGNMTIAVAGDITGDEARRLADRYFAPIPARPLPPPIRTREPEQKGPRTVVLENSAQPLLAMGFKRPDELDRDDTVLEVIRLILTGGRNGWLTKELIETKRIATSVQIQSSFPAGRYPHLFALTAVPAPGHTAAEIEKEATAVIGRLHAAKVDEATLQRARALARDGLARRLTENAQIAATLAIAAGELGDWHKIFSMYEDLGKVTAEQAQLAALKYLIPSRRTSVHMEIPPPAAPPARGGAQ
jgi:predicted Zn-dependent peptidase